jgi:hypothetical protein
MQKFVRENREHVVGGLMFLWNLRQNFWWRGAIVCVAAVLAYVVYFSTSHQTEMSLKTTVSTHGTSSSMRSTPTQGNSALLTTEVAATLLSVEVREKASMAREKAAREMLLESIAHTRSALEARRQAREAQRQQHVALATQLQEIEALRHELQRDREMIRRLSMQIEQRETFLSARWEEIKKQLQVLEAREKVSLRPCLLRQKTTCWR